VDLRAKSGKQLTRYFPEIIAALAEIEAPRFVLDGELLVPAARHLSFDAPLRVAPRPDRRAPTGWSAVFPVLLEMSPVLAIKCSAPGQIVEPLGFFLGPSTLTRRRPGRWHLQFSYS
jgi:hypothetical protein